MDGRLGGERQEAFRGVCLALHRLLSLSRQGALGEDGLVSAGVAAERAVAQATGQEHGLLLQERESTLVCNGVWLRPWVEGFLAQEDLVTSMQGAGVGELLLERGVVARELVALCYLLVERNAQGADELDPDDPDRALDGRGIERVHLGSHTTASPVMLLGPSTPGTWRGSTLRTVYVAEWLLRAMDPGQRVYPEFEDADAVRGAVYALADRFVDDPVFLHILEPLNGQGPAVAAGVAAALWALLLGQRLGFADESVLHLSCAAMVLGVLDAAPTVRGAVEEHLLTACAESRAAARALLTLDPGDGGFVGEDALPWLVPTLALAASIGPGAVAALQRSADWVPSHLMDEVVGLLEPPFVAG